MTVPFLVIVPHVVVRRARNERVVRVASQSDAAKFAHGCKRLGLRAKFKLGKSKRAWYVRVTGGAL